MVGYLLFNPPQIKYQLPRSLVIYIKISKRSITANLTVQCLVPCGKINKYVNN